jgi:hydroxyacylglutathione hydrolase
MLESIKSQLDNVANQERALYNRLMIHAILPVGMLRCNCSIFGDEQSLEAMVVDPGDDIGRVLEILQKHQLRVTAIVITHAHIDHIGGAQKLKQATGAPVYMNLNDTELQKMLDVQASWLGMAPVEPVAIDVPVKDGDSLVVGTTEFHVLDTPGHTQGSISLWIPSENKLVAGDTLFRDSIGRTDLPGGDGRQILRSIYTKLLPLPDETVVIPGHGENTTIGREKRFNYFLQ